MKTVKLLALGLIVLILSGVGYYIFGNYGDGYRAGTVIKLSRKGVLFKTYEGQLNMGMGIHDSSADIAVSNVWSFSVSASDSSALKALDSAIMTGKRTKLHYREKFVLVPWRGETKYQVYKVELTD